MRIVGLIVTFSAAIVVGGIVNGWALSILWHWFLVPLGVSQIGVAHAMGIAMTVAFATYQYDAKVAYDKGASAADLMITLIGSSMFRVAVALGVGAAIHSFM